MVIGSTLTEYSISVFGLFCDIATGYGVVVGKIQKGCAIFKP